MDAGKNVLVNFLNFWDSFQFISRKKASNQKIITILSNSWQALNRCFREITIKASGAVKICFSKIFSLIAEAFILVDAANNVLIKVRKYSVSYFRTSLKTKRLQSRKKAFIFILLWREAARYTAPARKG